MSFKIDIEHRGRFLTFGPRFKGEVGKDIFAAKIALGILRPSPETGELEPADLPELSFDPTIPLDEQKWFDCATGLGVDLAKATRFDTTLENALITFQLNNQFLITSYYFEKFGFLKLLNTATADEVLFEAEVASQMLAAMGLFESELRTLGEATIAVMHGWLPGTKLKKNTSYTHDSTVYTDTQQTSDGRLPVVIELLADDMYAKLLDPQYSQNFKQLVLDGIAIPNSLTTDNTASFVELESTRAWSARIGLDGEEINFAYGTMQLYPVLNATSALYNAATQVLDYYLENDLFSQTLSQQEIDEQATRAIYPDPFSRSGVFTIDGTRLGIYMETDYFLTADGPLPPSGLTTGTEIATALEEKALIKALGDQQRPQIWYFIKDEEEFLAEYFSSAPATSGSLAAAGPDHNGEYPSTITLSLSERLRKYYGDLYSINDPGVTEFYKENLWVLTTDNIIEQLEPEKAQHWRTIESQGFTAPLISFKEFIPPSLRPGQSYRALFEINRQKFELITDGEALIQSSQTEAEMNTDATPESVCLDQNSVQTERSYEEYRAHAIKRRRELVRKIREIVRDQQQPASSNVDMGMLEDLDLDFGVLGDFNNLNMNNASDYEVMQRLAQVLPGQEIVDFVTGFTADSKDRKLSDPNNDTNNLEITVEELKGRIDTAVEDLKEAQDIITRERIKFQKGSDFNGQNEAVQLSSFFTDLIDREFSKKYKNLSKEELETSLIWDFRATGIGKLGHRSGKDVTTFDGGATVGATERESKVMFPRPRTNNYLSLIRDMTGKVKISGFFDDSRNSCKDLGINIDKITAFAYVRKFTSGLQTAPGKEDEFSFKSWFADNIGDPVVEFGQKSGQNFMDSFDPDNFPEDAALRALGKECDLEKVWLGALDKLDLVSLLCDYIKCIKLPPFDFKAPDFRLPPLPKTPILGWYAGFYRFVRDNFEQIVTRLACTASKMIIDKLAFPLCEEQLEDFIQNDLLSEGPYARKAVIDALTQTGVPDAEQAKNFFDATANILTGREICYILNGNVPDDATMAAISRVANANGVSQYLGTSEDIINFFGVVGTYLPSEICEQLNAQTVLRPTKCDDTNDLLRGVRNRLQTGDSTLSDEEINRVVDMAEQSKQEEADRLKSFLDNGFEGSVPPIFQHGNKNSPMPDFPEHFKREQEKSAEAIFQLAKKSYGEGLAQYVPAMYIASPVYLWPYDPRYDQYETLRLETAIEQLAAYARVMEALPTGRDVEPPTIVNQFTTVHKLYETEVIRSLPEYLIPADKREGLEIHSEIDVADDEVEIRYKIPHTYQRFSAYSSGDASSNPGFRIIDRGDGATVHKRRIMPKQAQRTTVQVQAEIEALNVIINRFSTRINRIESLNKRRRLRGERRAVINRKKALEKLLERPNANGLYSSEDNTVSYEFFLLYQKKFDSDEFQGLDYEFGLVPKKSGEGDPDTGIYSRTREFADFEVNDDLIENYPDFVNGSGVTNTEGIGEYIRSRTGLSGNDTNSTGASLAVEMLQERFDHLQSTITEILTNKPPLIDQILFAGLQELTEKETEVSLEEVSPSDQTVEISGNEFTIQFKANAIYSPKITLRELPAADDKDRYDMEVSGDFFIGLSLGGATEEAEPEVKTFRYCEQLPGDYLLPRRYTLTDSTPVFGKRHRFQNIVLDSLDNILRDPLDQSAFENQVLIKEYIPDALYKTITEALIESLMNDLSDSYLFEADEVNLLDRRVVGKREIKNCISNRFSFGKNSVVSFNKTILGDVSKEIAKEMAKPENSPENYDFDSPSPFDLAMQTLAFRGFINACLIDILLKGGLAYSVWDIETIVENKFFIDYSIAHVLDELNSSSELKDSWRRNVEKVMGISNSKIALELLVKQELVKLPNYSKQVFHPDDNSTNFYNWFQEIKLKHFHVSRLADISALSPGGLGSDQPRQPVIGAYHNRVYSSDQKIFFAGEKPFFIIEHYIKINGEDLVKIYKNALFPAGDVENKLLRRDDSYIILNVRDFMQANSSLEQSDLDEALKNSKSLIEQGIRVVLVDPTPHTERVEGGVRISPDQNKFLTQIPGSPVLFESSSRIDSVINRSIAVLALQENNTYQFCFALPLAKHERVLDFEDCYSILEYDEEKFQKAIPFMNQELSKNSEYVLLLEHIFPARRLMTMVSTFATSVVSGYNSMPNIMTPTKSDLALLVKRLGQGRVQRADLRSLSQEEFVKQLTENFPADEGDCIEFPGGFEDMFKKFFEELWKLIKQMPSIVFRGVANQIDPAYKEMRQHYINCDIKNLTYRGLQPAGTLEYKLTNGLYLDGRTPFKIGSASTREAMRLQGKDKGKYVPLATGLTSDFVYSFFPLKDLDYITFGLRLGITISKLVAYIYSSNRPFLDPAAYFKIPCADIDVGAWRDSGRYDAGPFGRYGHPLSPFTLLALATPQLETDKRQKENNCIILPEECIEVDTGLAGTLPAPEREDREDYWYHTTPTSARGPCEPWTQQILDEVRELIRVREELKARNLHLVGHWEEAAADPFYYMDHQRGPTKHPARDNFIADPDNNRIGSIAPYLWLHLNPDYERTVQTGFYGGSYNDLDEFRKDFLPPLNHPHGDVHEEGTSTSGARYWNRKTDKIEHTYYQVFYDLWEEYKDNNMEMNTIQYQIYQLANNRCLEFENQDVSYEVDYGSNQFGDWDNPFLAFKERYDAEVLAERAANPNQVENPVFDDPETEDDETDFVLKPNFSDEDEEE